MTYHDDFTLSAALLEQGSLEQLSTQGLGALPDLFPVLLNAAMQIERQKHLGAAPHERTEERAGHANGYKDKKTWFVCVVLARGGEHANEAFCFKDLW